MTSPQSGSPAAVLQELEQLKRLVEETEASLKSQREILQVRGMSLPPMVMQAVTGLKKDITRLEDGFMGDQTELAQLRSLTDTSALINTSLDLENVLAQAMDVVIALTNAERGYIIMRDEKDELVITVAQEAPGTIHGEGPQLSQTILRHVIQTGQPLLADNAFADERLQSGQSIAQMSLRSVLCVPLKYKDDLLGLVYVDNRVRTGLFTEREKTLLAAFANQASVALANAQLYRSLQDALMQIGDMKSLMDDVFASIGSGIITTDAHHAIMTINRAAAQILNRDPESAVHQPAQTLFPNVADLDQMLWQAHLQERVEQTETELEVVGRGRVILTLKFSPLRGPNQEAQGVVIVMDDVTQQREHAQMLDVFRRYLPPGLITNIDQISKLDLGGERRTVTSMFIDVRPLNSYPSDMRPQQLVEQVNTYLSRATECIHRHEGVIDKYMGTVIMVLFNTQLNPMDDHALRAAQMALALRETFVQLYHDLGIDPQPHYYRMGMHSGVATLGNVGSWNRREFSAIGDTINLSKRVEENAKYGQIVLSENTLDYIQQYLNGQPLPFDLVEREPTRVKGRQQETRMYEVFKLP